MSLRDITNTGTKYNFNFQNQESWNNKSFHDAENFNKDSYELTVMAANKNFIDRVSATPDTISNRINSISYITDKKHRTFLSIQGGFILKVPEKCIYTASPKDTFAINEYIDDEGTDENKENDINNIIKELYRLNRSKGISTPEYLSRATIKNQINELDAIGNTSVIGLSEHHKIEIAGTYIKVSTKMYESLKFEYELGGNMSMPRTKEISAILKEKEIKPVNNSLRNHFYTLIKYSEDNRVPFIHIPEEHKIS